LKPDVLPSRRRSEMVRRCLRFGAQALLPCENDQAKLDPFSRLACSTNLSKILTAYPPERAVWIEAMGLTPRCPRTCCACQICVLRHSSAFLREPFKLIELSSSCQAQSFPRSRPLKLVVGG
jgi:hypothetical protein